MQKQSAHLFVAVILALLGPLAQNGRGDFILYDNDQLTVNSYHSKGTLYDDSRAIIVSGGFVVESLFANNYSNVDIYGKVDWPYAHDYSTVNISGGIVRGLHAYDSSNVNIFNGVVYYLSAFNSSSVNMTNGNIYDIDVINYSSVNMTNGNIYTLKAHESSNVDISGGYVDYLHAYDGSINISGGSMTGLHALGLSVVTFNCRDFLVSDGLTLDGNRVLGTGILSGNWMDRTPWLVHIISNDPSATILAITEPTHILTIDVDPNDVGIDTITPSVGAHSCGGWVRIKAERFINCPDVYTFDHWEGDVNDPNLANTTVFMDTDKTVTAVFVDGRQCGDECHPYPAGDIDKNCIVDFNDFGLFALSWLECTKPECD